MSLLHGAVWDIVVTLGGTFVLAYGSLSGCHTNRQTLYAIKQAHFFSQAFKEGGGV